MNHSGGKDSVRMLGRLREEYPDVESICVTADTGFEQRKRIPAAEWVKMRCTSLVNTAPVVVVRNAKKTYLEMVERRGKFPSAQFRQCTADLKRGPIVRFIRTRLSLIAPRHPCAGIAESCAAERMECQRQAGNQNANRVELAADFRGDEQQVLEWFRK